MDVGGYLFMKCILFVAFIVVLGKFKWFWEGVGLVGNKRVG